MLCYVMLCYAMLCYAMLCYVMLCYVMLCYVMLCYLSMIRKADECLWHALRLLYFVVVVLLISLKKGYNICI